MGDTELKIETVKITDLAEYEGNAKQHPEYQIEQIANSIEQFGNCDPIGVWTDPNGQLVIVEGHGRYQALKRLGRDMVPVIRLDHLTDEQRRAYALVHNQLTMNTGWDWDAYLTEINGLDSINLEDMGVTLASDITYDNLFDSDLENKEKEAQPEHTEEIVTCPHCGKDFSRE